MTPAEVLGLIKEKDVKFVDLRFTDTIGKEHHVTLPAMLWMKTFLKTAKCLTAHRFPDGRESMNPT